MGSFSCSVLHLPRSTANSKTMPTSGPSQYYMAFCNVARHTLLVPGVLLLSVGTDLLAHETPQLGCKAQPLTMLRDTEKTSWHLILAAMPQAAAPSSLLQPTPLHFSRPSQPQSSAAAFLAATASTDILQACEHNSRSQLFCCRNRCASFNISVCTTSWRVFAADAEPW
jgi:hypothetical protein